MQNSKRTLEIKQAGQTILDSRFFKDCLEVKHHKNTTVGIHMIEVALKSLEIADFLEKHNIKIDRQILIIASLSHDLAMAHAKEWYGLSGYFTTAFRHPIDSYKILKSIMPVNDKIKKAITRHMWPLCIIPPTSIEGWIITIADKNIAMSDLGDKNTEISF